MSEIVVCCDCCNGEEEQFAEWLNKHGHTATVGHSTGSYVDGKWTQHDEEAQELMNKLWDQYCGDIMSELIKIKIDAKAFIESLLKQDDGSTLLDEGIVSAYLADLLNDAGIEAEARYQDTDWSISIKGKKYYSSMSFYDKPEEGLLSAIRYFADEVNSGKDFEAWYSYSNKEHCLNLSQKEPGTEPEEP